VRWDQTYHTPCRIEHHSRRSLFLLPGLFEDSACRQASVFLPLRKIVFLCQFAQSPNDSPKRLVFGCAYVTDVVVFLDARNPFEGFVWNPLARFYG
jgi:hypothetical protein